MKLNSGRIGWKRRDNMQGEVKRLINELSAEWAANPTSARNGLGRYVVAGMLYLAGAGAALSVPGCSRTDQLPLQQLTSPTQSYPIHSAQHAEYPNSKPNPNNSNLQATASQKSRPPVANFVPPNRPPYGAVEIVNCKEIKGYAVDPDNPSQSIPVHFYMDGIILVDAVYTGERRPDIGYDAGFSIPMPNAFRDGKAHTMQAYGVGVNRWGQIDGLNARLVDTARYLNSAGQEMPGGTIVCPPRLTVKE